VERIKSGIPELDDMLRGGFIRGDAVLVAGPAGTGKTTLALQYIVNGITQFRENGIYVTFEQLPDQIYRDAASYGWDLRKMEDEDKLRLVCTSPNLLLEGQAESILDEPVSEIHPRRIAIDSLSHFQLFVREREVRREIYRLLMYLKTKGLSAIGTWDAPQMAGQTFSVTEVGLSFLVDCIVLLRFVEIESSLRKALTILKIRGSDHDKELREFKITGQGIEIGKPFSQYEGIIGGAPRKSWTEETMTGWAKAFAGKP
jgi:circadian clock protein KaiC